MSQPVYRTNGAQEMAPLLRMRGGVGGGWRRGRTGKNRLRQRSLDPTEATVSASDRALPVAASRRRGEPLIISDIKKGSVAHR